MYKYICPYCGNKNYSEFNRHFTDEYFKYRTDVCATATCHQSLQSSDPFHGEEWHKGDPLNYLVVTSMDICSICPGRLECMILPVVVAEVVSPEDLQKLKPRGRRWRETIRDEQRIRTKK